MFQNKRHFKYLIEEVKSTHALEEQDLKKLVEKRYYNLKMIRKNEILKKMQARKKQLMLLFRNEVTSDLLNFLSKVQERLEDEQRVHAFAMLAERERWKREAAESGRRQREETFRKRHDEAFKQVMNIRQETVDMYLEDTILRSVDLLASDKAREHVRKIANKIDLAAQEAEYREDMIEQEEIILNLLHNFVVPEAHKEITRRKLEEKQKKYLEVANMTVMKQLLSNEPISALVLPQSSTYASERHYDDELKTIKPRKTIDEELECSKQRKLRPILPLVSSPSSIASTSSSNLPQNVKDTAVFSFKFTEDIIKSALDIAKETAVEAAGLNTDSILNLVDGILMEAYGRVNKECRIRYFQEEND